MTRVQVSSAAGGSPVALTFVTNPRAYEAQDSTFVSTFETLHGSPINQNRAWDGRPRTLTWKANEVGSANIEPIDTYFRSIEGKIRYLNFGTMDDINLGWPNTDTWKKLRVISVRAKYREGGKLKYDSFAIVVQPEQ